MDHTQTARLLVERHGRTFAEEAGIHLTDEPGPLWQLVVLAQLLSARIPSSTAVATAREVFAAGWTTPEALRGSTWRERVTVLGRGGYRRYDFSTATRLDDNAAHVLTRWGGDLRGLRHEAGGDARRVARLLQELTGIGPTGASIVLREVQDVWPQVRPSVDPLVRTGAVAAGLPAEAEALAALAPDGLMAPLCAALVRVARKPALLDGCTRPGAG